MQHVELAARLVAASNAEREALLHDHAALAGVTLAYVLKDICQRSWRTDPTSSLQAAATLSLLTTHNNNLEIAALANWAGGIAALIEGQMEKAVDLLDAAETGLLKLRKEHLAASTQLAKILALAMLGRYDEAIECGRRAREVFLRYDDQMEAGRIENNLGNLFFRRDQYLEAEEFQTIARERFVKIGNQEQLAIINNCLANTHATLHKFKSAESLYEQAVEQAENANLKVTLAEIEGNIGNFTLLQGRYDRALDYLERARRRYAELDMPHQSAVSEQEIADAYLELNLYPEAIAIYERVIPKFLELGMRAEQARALAYQARAEIGLGKSERAHNLLDEAARLYVAEGNDVGGALVKLTLAQLLHAEKRAPEARAILAEAEPVLAAAGATRRLLFLHWLYGESSRSEGLAEEALAYLRQTLTEAEGEEQPDIAARCLTSLGLLASTQMQREDASVYFHRAIELIENLRAPIPAEEFRTSFFADKLVPYHEMVRLCLDDSEPRIAEALGFVERARSRALAETISQAGRPETAPRDDFEAGLIADSESLRGELNYLYNQMNRSQQPNLRDLRVAIREREARLLELSRQLKHRSSGSAEMLAAPFAISDLQERLSEETAVIEYANIEDELLAFVITREDVVVFRELASQQAIAAEVSQFRFQVDSLRFGSERVRRHLNILTSRIISHLQTLYGHLLRPLEPALTERRLVVVPHQALHYLPFQALHDGEACLLEKYEVSYAPSARVLSECLKHSRRPLQSALLVGVADEQIPRVRDEIESLKKILPNALVLLDAAASLESIKKNAAEMDLVHLACHAQFRSDNPLFSSLHLGNGWLTVRDSYNLKLDCELVTLSACETGVNAIAPGDELIGLARGFFSAGSPSILLSLWTVDDDATAELMSEFYRQAARSETLAGALRTAQLKLLREKPHPFFWSPFVLAGHW